MWLFVLYLIVPLTHSSYKVTAAISEISLYQWSKSSPQLFLAFGPEPRSINLIPPPLRGHPSKLSVCKNSTPLGLPWWYSGKTPFLMQEAQVQSLVSELRSHMPSSQKNDKKAKHSFLPSGFYHEVLLWVSSRYDVRKSSLISTFPFPATFRFPFHDTLEVFKMESCIDWQIKQCTIKRQPVSITRLILNYWYSSNMWRSWMEDYL